MMNSFVKSSLLLLFFTIFLTSYVFAQCGKERAKWVVDHWYTNEACVNKIDRILTAENQKDKSQFNQKTQGMSEENKLKELHKENMKAIFRDLKLSLSENSCLFTPQSHESELSIKQEAGDLTHAVAITTIGSTAAITGAAAYAVLNAGFWATLFAGGAGVAMGTLTAVPVIGWAIGGAGLVGGAYYYYSLKKDAKKNRIIYLDDICKALTNSRYNITTSIVELN